VTVLTLSSLCPHSVLTLSSHCPHSVLTLSSLCAHTVLTLCSHCAHTVLTLCSHCPHSVLTLCSHCPHTVLTLSSLRDFAKSLERPWACTHAAPPSLNRTSSTRASPCQAGSAQSLTRTTRSSHPARPMSPGSLEAWAASTPELRREREEELLDGAAGETVRR